MRIPLIAGNWKMNKTVAQSLELVEELKGKVAGVSGVEILVCPPFTSLYPVQQLLAASNIALGAQNMYWEEEGAYTGETSPPMLQAIGCSYVILGHSERREHFNECNEEINRKLKAALEHDLTPILCLGETLEEREEGQTAEVVKDQLEKGIAGVDEDKMHRLVVAYEPIWAIGTGKSATAKEAGQVTALLRERLSELAAEAAGEIRILYGGSVKPHNISELMAEDEIDGALVGGASLEAASFAGIVKNCG